MRDFATGSERIAHGEERFWQFVNALVRRHGYGVNTVTFLRTQVGESTHQDPNQLLVGIHATVEPMCESANKHSSLPGSSEELELLIGKGKRLHGTFQISNSGCNDHFKPGSRSPCELPHQTFETKDAE